MHTAGLAASSLAQVCSSSLPPLYALEHLQVKIPWHRSHWQDDIENTQWQELLYPFTSVKKLVLSCGSARCVTPTLKELAGEGVTVVLPMLQDILLEGSQQSEPVKKAIRQFITARQLPGHPAVALYYVDRERQQDKVSDR